MRIHFTHHTHYRYSRAVSLQPQLLRLRPREDGFQRLASYACQIRPAKHRQALLIDIEGNALIKAWFQGPSSSLDIQCSGLVEIDRDNPYDFLLDAEAVALPLKGLAMKHPALLPCLMLGDMPAAQKKTRDLGAGIHAESGGDTLAYLGAALRALGKSLKRVTREGGEAWAPEETLRQVRGSCRDLAVLFMELCRMQGLPARFVSGYYLEHPGRRDHDLHAWAEVYLPGAGWRGFDPSCGLACAGSHVALCAAARPLDCAPVSGTFNGGGSAELSVALELKA